VAEEKNPLRKGNRGVSVFMFWLAREKRRQGGKILSVKTPKIMHREHRELGEVVRGGRHTPAQEKR